MKNKTLHHLNFQELLQYPDSFSPRHFYDEPISCRGFCVHCEKSGVLERAKGALTLMSHGCDTSDFESLFEKPLPAPEPVKDPILFLLQDPGGDYELGEEQTFSGVTKKPPIRHYYFSTGLPGWPESVEDLDGNYYGSYFAYILNTHSLSNAYITNLVKCKLVKCKRGSVERPKLVEDACFHRFLSREIEEFRPRVVFCFGRRVHNSLRARMPDQRCVWLLHPSFIQNRSYTQGLSPREAILENERRIREELQRL